MQHHTHDRTLAKIAAFAAAGTLLFAGFGCRPILDARVEEEARKPSKWIVDEPRFRYEIDRTTEGRVTIDMRVPTDVSVNMTLTGPGVLSQATQTQVPDENGVVVFRWTTNRVGRYEYSGQIILNRLVVDTFDGFDDVY